jgi:hypothetical protein
MWTVGDVLAKALLLADDHRITDPIIWGRLADRWRRDSPVGARRGRNSIGNTA